MDNPTARVLQDLRAKRDLDQGDFIARPKSATMAETIAALPALIAAGYATNWGDNRTSRTPEITRRGRVALEEWEAASVG